MADWKTFVYWGQGRGNAKRWFAKIVLWLAALSLIIPIKSGPFAIDTYWQFEWLTFGRILAVLFIWISIWIHDKYKGM